jgi:hypothetical protein
MGGMRDEFEVDRIMRRLYSMLEGDRHEYWFNLPNERWDYADKVAVKALKRCNCDVDGACWAHRMLPSIEAFYVLRKFKDTPPELRNHNPFAKKNPYAANFRNMR